MINIQRTIFTEISGYLRNQFIQKNENISEYFAVITDGTYKLDIIIWFELDEQINRGTKIEIVGDLQESGIT